MAGAAVLVTILGALSFFPRFSITQPDEFVRAEQLTVPLGLSYDGLVPLRDVRATCEILHALDPGRSLLQGVLIGERRITDWMVTGDEFAIGCHEGYENPVDMTPIVEGEVQIAIRYKPILLPIYMHKSIYLSAAIGRDSILHWRRVGEGYIKHPSTRKIY